MATVSFGLRVASVLRKLVSPRVSLPLMAALALAGCPDHVKEKAVDLGRACKNGETDKAVSATNALLRELECNGIYVGPASDAPSERPEAAPLTDAELEALVRENTALFEKLQGEKVCDGPPPPNPHFSICSLFNPAPNQNKAVGSMRIGQTLSALELRGEALNLFTPGATPALPAGSSLSVVFYLAGTATVDANVTAALAATPITAAGNIALASIAIGKDAALGQRSIVLIMKKADGTTIEIGRLNNVLEVKSKPDGNGGSGGALNFGQIGGA